MLVPMENRSSSGQPRLVEKYSSASYSRDPMVQAFRFKTGAGGSRRKLEIDTSLRYEHIVLSFLFTSNKDHQIYLTGYNRNSTALIKATRLNHISLLLNQKEST